MIDPEDLRVMVLGTVFLVGMVDIGAAFIIRAQREASSTDDDR